MINVTDKRVQLKWNVYLGRMMWSLETKLAKQLQPILGGAYSDVARLIKSGVGISFTIDLVVNKRTAQLERTLEAGYTRTSQVFSEMVYDIIEKGEKSWNGASVAGVRRKSVRDEYWRVLRAWIIEQVAEQVILVDRTTKNSIKRVIDAGFAKGKGLNEVAKDLFNIKDLTSYYRAHRIARTETHTTAVFSTRESINSTGMETESQWSTSIDERTRSIGRGDEFDHIAADGERIKKGEKYVRTGEPLDHPGDPKGSAANIIDCRCVELFFVVRSAISRTVKPSEPEEELHWEKASNESKLVAEFKRNLGIEKIKINGYEKDREKALEDGNRIGEHWFSLTQKYPLLKEKNSSRLKKGKSSLKYLKLFNDHSIGKKAAGRHEYLINNVTGEHLPQDIRLATQSVTWVRGKSGRMKGELRWENPTKIGKDSLVISQGSILGNARHEWGHFVYYNYLEQKDRARWKRFYKGIPKDSISRYGSTNESEGFAESFSAYTAPDYGESPKKKLPSIIDMFFKKLLGK